MRNLSETNPLVSLLSAYLPIPGAKISRAPLKTPVAVYVLSLQFLPFQNTGLKTPGHVLTLLSALGQAHLPL